MNIWDKVKLHQGETFKTVTGLEFIYEVIGETVIHTRSKEPISRPNFEKAIQLNPQKPSGLQYVVTGPSYVYAIITDPRLW